MGKKNFVDIILFSLFILLVVFISLFVILNFQKEMKSYYSEMCKDTGGSWNFYDCYYNIETNHSSCFDNNIKSGYWCDYPDGSSISEEEISWVFNSTV